MAVALMCSKNRTVGIAAEPSASSPRLIVHTTMPFAISPTAPKLKPTTCGKSRLLQALWVAGARDNVQSLLASS